MEQSQMPAAPTPAMSAGELVAKLHEAETVEAGTEKENRENAAREIAMIEELLGSAAFQWFESEFLLKPYLIAFGKLRDRFIKPEELPNIQRQYTALREVVSGMPERELAHREAISPSDPRIAVLRAKLAAL